MFTSKRWQDSGMKSFINSEGERTGVILSSLLHGNLWKTGKETWEEGEWFAISTETRVSFPKNNETDTRRGRKQKGFMSDTCQGGRGDCGVSWPQRGGRGCSLVLWKSEHCCIRRWRMGMWWNFKILQENNFGKRAIEPTRNSWMLSTYKNKGKRTRKKGDFFFRNPP